MIHHFIDNSRAAGMTSLGEFGSKKESSAIALIDSHPSPCRRRAGDEAAEKAGDEYHCGDTFT
jgi:hypothetical protein